MAAIDIVNRSLELIGDQSQISALNDGTVAGNAAGVLYAPCVQLLLRQMDPAFARRTVGLSASGGTAPAGFAYTYGYPTDCLRVRQVRPSAGAYNALDPQPVRAAVWFDNSLVAKVIVSNLGPTNVSAVYTSLGPTESVWDAGFGEAVARRLANPLSMALAGRPDFARELLEESDRFASLAELTDDL